MIYDLLIIDDLLFLLTYLRDFCILWVSSLSRISEIQIIYYWEVENGCNFEKVFVLVGYWI